MDSVLWVYGITISDQQKQTPLFILVVEEGKELKIKTCG
jgi:hypothetical protein